VPLQGAATEAIDTSALATRGGSIAAPEVVVDGVRTLDLVVPLTAEVSALGKSRSRGGGRRNGESSSAGKRKECGELHDENDVKEEEVIEKE
jgi:hypothetical protein